MPPRFFVDRPLNAGDTFSLAAGPARHVQVLRLQPGAAITLFNGEGGEWEASVSQMGRREVTVQIGKHTLIDRELPLSVTLALGMPANERMDTVIEKATELGVFAIQPLICERSVLRLNSERAQRKVAHWQGIALAACEQSGRTRVPRIETVRVIGDWLRNLTPSDDARWLLSLSDAKPIAAMSTSMHGDRLICLSGPEGGLTRAEESAACERGYAPISLGPRVLRADTAPLAVLAYLALGRPLGRPLRGPDERA
jgi:16S rRNA (uracil1498-N3)-methyltransferase